MMPLVIIVGPTACGKTELAVKLSHEFSGEIVNADSRQVYQELQIGVNQPSREFFETVPHHLFGMSAVNQSFDAGIFERSADRVIADIHSRNRVPFIVGGTGLYVKALLFGLFDGPPRNESIRKNLEQKIQTQGLWSLHEELKKVDPESANKIHPNDPTRIIRALEVYLSTKKPISVWQAEHQFKKPKYRYLKIGLKMDRDVLYGRINRRVDQMIEQGLEQEVRNLWKKWGEHDLLARSIGYKEWFPYFKGDKNLAWVSEQIKQHTRNFAKRQLTWFRQEKDIQWFDQENIREMQEAIHSYLVSMGEVSMGKTLCY